MRNKVKFALAAIAIIIAVIVWTCGKSSSNSSSQTGAIRSLTANITSGQTVTTPYGGTCTQLNRDTSSCQSARTALGLSGNWLLFSCNVVLGLATSSGVSTTNYSQAAYVTLTTVDLPDYKSNYYSTSGNYNFVANGYTVTGSFSSLYSPYTTSFPDPNNIASQSLTMNIPISPTHLQSAMSMGAVGVSINGVLIYDSVAGNTDNIFEESGSFDQCQGHAAPAEGGTYHYHSEPYSISYNDNNLIGVMRDGYFIYGQKDYANAAPSATANSATDLDTYGGHVGSQPLDGTGSQFHYHATYWHGCYDRSGQGPNATIRSDDGNANTDPNTNPCTLGTGVAASAYFLTGHGNGGVFQNPPSGVSNSLQAVRYYYGTPGACTGC